jgi:hypothetical protein
LSPSGWGQPGQQSKTLSQKKKRNLPEDGFSLNIFSPQGTLFSFQDNIKNYLMKEKQLGF